MLMGHSIAQNIIPHNIAFGDPTQGGLNGKIIRVTTLDPEGPGSIKEAIETEGPRVIVFEVGGIIDLNKKFGCYRAIPNHCRTNSPFSGITFIRGGFWINTHDIVIQHIRVRPGDAAEAVGLQMD